MPRPFAFLLALMVVVSCAQKQTKIVLLPQDNGKIGAVTMSSAQGDAVTLDKPYMVSQSGTMEVAQADPEAINKEYGSLFKMELKRPPEEEKKPEKKPEKFILFFEKKTTMLTEASRETLAQIHDLLKKMPPTRIQVLGFTDTQCGREKNLTLSSERADKVARLLNREDGSSNRVEIRGYGEHGLAFRTPDNTPDPRNRRVKVLIFPSE